MRPLLILALAALTACSAAPPAALEVGDQLGQAHRGLEAERALQLDRPGKVVVVVFFATWSEAARAVLAEVEELQARLAGQGVEAVGVAIDEDQRFVAPFVRELGLTFEVLADPGARETQRIARLESVPTVAVLDAERTVRLLSSDPRALSELESLVVSLASKPVERAE
ncbi:MAG: TlpA disulfide reductase family protein [Myxococcales bacterium]|jgi:cytochrome c biogenesis protein CcmG/thiol:disulfide interchange protein DsbE